MYSYDDIRQVHLELTSSCNARCPQCARSTPNGGVSPSLPITELRLRDVQAILTPEFVQQLEHVCLCGNYGDPTAALDSAEIVEYLRRCKRSLSIQLNSNGSARTATWWRNMAELGVRCVFSIDGLEDTNHVYRIGTRWDTIVRNARAFIERDGEAIWEYIVFGHNEHQVEAARALSTHLGFSRFFVKRTGRFLRDGVHSIQPSKGTTIQPPSSTSYLNPEAVALSKSISTLTPYEHYLDSTEIACRAVRDRGLYISAEGLVFPCCYLGNIHSGFSGAPERQLAEVMTKLPFGKSSLSALHQSLRTIVGGPFFQSVVPSGWGVGAESRLKMCAQQCGRFDVIGAQRESRI